jgi:hypothetical protein
LRLAISSRQILFPVTSMNQMLLSGSGDNARRHARTGEQNFLDLASGVMNAT